MIPGKHAVQARGFLLPLLCLILLVFPACGGGGGGDGEAASGGGTNQPVSIPASSYANFHSRWDYSLAVDVDPENPLLFRTETEPEALAGGVLVRPLQATAYLDGETMNRDLYLADQTDGLFQAGFVDNPFTADEVTHMFNEPIPWLLSDFVPGRVYRYRDISLSPEPEDPWWSSLSIVWVFEDVRDFPDCIRARATYRADDGQTVQITRWYAKNVGMVREERDYSAGNRSVTEIISYNAQLGNNLFSGDFHVVRLGLDTGSAYVSVGEAGLAGGAGTCIETANSLGAAAGAAAVDYTVAADGTFTWSEAGRGEWQGAANVEGQVFSAADTEDADGGVSMMVGVRMASSAAGNFTSGRYRVVLREGPAEASRCAVATLDLDGQGGYTLREVLAQDGLPETRTGTYAVDGLGRLALDGSTGGAVAGDGSFFIHADTDSAGGQRVLMGVRQEGIFMTRSLWGEYLGALTETGGGPRVLEAEFDGLGAGTVENSLAAGTPWDAMDAAYSVSSAGTVALDVETEDGLLLLDGGMREDSQLVLAAGAARNSQLSAFGLFVRISRLTLPTE